MVFKVILLLMLEGCFITWVVLRPFAAISQGKSICYKKYDESLNFLPITSISIECYLVSTACCWFIVATSHQVKIITTLRFEHLLGRSTGRLNAM